MKLTRTLALPLALALVSPVMTGCVNPVNLFRPGFGAIVHYESVPGASEKFGVTAITDSGRWLFRVNGLAPPKELGRGGGYLTFVGGSVPQVVNIHWHEPIFHYRFNPNVGRTTRSLELGKIIAEHQVPVASRIPKATLRYARGGKGRAILLIFRILDDRVLLAWTVQETVYNPDNRGRGRVYSHYGGDLNCADPGAMIFTNRCTAGKLEDAPWYNPRWEFVL